MSAPSWPAQNIKDAGISLYTIRVIDGDEKPCCEGCASDDEHVL